MSWTRKQFLAVLSTPIAQTLFADNEVAAYVKGWSDENKAALLHANGIVAESSPEASRDMLQLVAAFGRKDEQRVRELLYDKQVTAGARLDYLLPLFDEKFRAGEDIFVAAVKVMLNGNKDKNVKLPAWVMKHEVGESAGQFYTADELAQLEGYVNNSFALRELLRLAPNKTNIQPVPEAVDYIVNHADTYRDSNQNPVMVFIPGAISIDAFPMLNLIAESVKHGGDPNAVGFFGVPGVVWSIILGDVEAVDIFLTMNAKLDKLDEMGNQHVLAWAAATLAAVADDPGYAERMHAILTRLGERAPANALYEKNYQGLAPADYLSGGSSLPQLNDNKIEHNSSTRMFL